MFLYKIMGAVLLGSCVGMGMWNHMSRRKTAFEEYRYVIVFLQKLRNGITQRKLLLTAIEEAAEGSDEGLQKAVQKLLESWEQDPSLEFEGLWNTLCSALPLTKDDRRRISFIGLILGSQDMIGQLRQLDSVIRVLEQHVGEEEEAWRHQRNLYCRLSVLLSLLLTVILL